MGALATAIEPTPADLRYAYVTAREQGTGIIDLRDLQYWIPEGPHSSNSFESLDPVS